MKLAVSSAKQIVAAAALLHLVLVVLAGKRVVAATVSVAFGTAGFVGKSELLRLRCGCI
ncbi:MAG: hypothetical protein J6B32_01155 [Spirochaetaceae bacterium]|nr:hypothetical protein [Spirochaetaceae bacterium]